MAPPPSPASPRVLVKYITHTDLFKALDDAALPDVENELEWVYLRQSDTIFQQGSNANCLYIVVAGKLGVVITQPDGTPSSPDALTPGSVVGEMGLFTGQTPVRVLYAIADTNLVKLSKAGFDRLVKKHPQIVSRFSQLMSPRLRAVQLASAFDRLFGALSEQALQSLEGALEWLNLSNGDVLVRQGDTDDSLYIVVSGRLCVMVASPNGEQRILAEISRGESIGELALLTGEVRSATVQAIRDTVVVRLTKASFDRLIEKFPQLMVEITRLIVQRYQQSIGSAAPAKKDTATIALIPAGRNAPVAGFAKQLVTALEAYDRTLHLNSRRFDRMLSKEGAAQTPRGDPTSLALETWLNEQETIYEFIIYEADVEWTSWTRRCIRNADRILLIGSAESEPVLSKIERQMRQFSALASQELVLLHPGTTERPHGTVKWLERRQVQSHHHIRFNIARDMQRLVRHLTGRSIGLVFSGGGARAFAHIGAIRAIQEAGIPIDLVGGASLGSVVAAAYALDWDYVRMVEAAETFFSPTKIFDYTFPAVAFVNSKKMTRTLFMEFHDIEIEDMWLPYFCVSSNLSQARLVVHQQGALWKSLRSSCSLPGIFTPVVEGENLLVDGAVLNNIPVDIMYDLCQGGSVIAVDVSAETHLADHYDFISNLSGWKVLWSRLNPLTPSIKAPSLMDTLKRAIELNSVRQRQKNKSLADIFINPPVASFGLTDFEAYKRLIDIGYKSAQSTIQSWVSRNGGSGNHQFE